MKKATPMRTKHILICFLIGLVAMFSSGCFGTTQAYPGGSRSGAETATLIPQGVRLHKVNGFDIGTLSSGVTIIPGPNEIELSLNESNFNLRDPSQARYKLLMDAKPGMKYAITGQRGDGRLCAFPLDPRTGQPEFSAPAGCLTRQ